MFLFLTAYLLANTSVYSRVSTDVEGTGTSYTKIQTTVNGNTTTVESNQPGTVSVVKTDNSEHVVAQPPVTITHSQTIISPFPTLQPSGSTTTAEKRCSDTHQ